MLLFYTQKENNNKMYIYEKTGTNQYNLNFCANKISISKIRQDIEGGKTISEIAKLYNISERTVYNIIKQFNLPNIKEIINQKLNDALSDKINETASLKALSEQTGFSIYAIKKWIKEHIGMLPKIEKRKKILEAIHSTKLNREIAEEYNVPINTVKSLRYEHNAGNIKKKKQECLNKILILQKNGLSGRKIAKKLNINNSTVYRLLKQYRNNELMPD